MAIVSVRVLLGQQTVLSLTSTSRSAGLCFPLFTSMRDSLLVNMVY